ncbi:unnamed protein product [Medioppia subpectinata]|uniref:Uncharacterized protein n=1 Tax=Medioppia subpectinata TaxID=1979941 RepID=A0A7R9LL21_9ACAR|nr:unnamed protein product [Medioppia subpectinata]CAG2119747.1 unnamed protein product [Medioppia subpectinata]
METRRIVKGFHTKKTNSFVRACIAYSFITIPSLDDVILRLQLYLSSSYVSLINGCLPQTDSFLKTAITLIQQLPQYIDSSDGRPKSTDPFLLSYTSQLLSFLLIVPESYPYHISKVDSNDTLYGNESQFMEQISSLSGTVLNDILEYLQQLSDEGQYKRQSSVALELFCRIISHGDVKKMHKLLINLWQLSKKNSSPDIKRSEIAIKYLRQKANHSSNPILLDLLFKIDNRS